MLSGRQAYEFRPARKEVWTMAMRKKGAERAAMDQLEVEDVTSFGEDPELLDPAEEAALAAGNADGPQTQRRQESSQTDEPAQESPAGAERQPQAEYGAERAEEERETLSDEQVHTMGPNDRVPAWSLVKERQENRALKRNLDELTRKLAEHEEKWNRASDRLRQFQDRAGIAAAAATRPAPDPEPDVKADPEAHYQWELRQHRQALEALHQQQQVSTAQAQAAQHQAVLTGLEQQFILAGHPDYYERVSFLRERRNRELELMGYTDTAERAQIIANEAAMLVSGAIRQGRNPAIVAHELSQQWGYKPAVTASVEAAQPGNGAGVSAADRIRDLQRKKAASTSLQAIASRPADGPLTLEDIAEMDDEAYERYVDKNGGDLAGLFRSGR
ncbi:MAG TPA: hypothetical protein VGY99_15445 [Candidatus Binataceae bacterium]|jgi:hypothetical protein|nr:hypothetical protein [Candidatus Binataceae bacterium]